MKLSLKFSLAVILLIAAVLSLGCVLFLQQDFDENIRQAKTAAEALLTALRAGFEQSRKSLFPV